MSKLRVTPEMLQILKHSTGYPESYRNHFATDKNTPDFDSCEKLVSGKLMSRRDAANWMGGGYIYHVTAEGMAYLSPCKDKELEAR